MNGYCGFAFYYDLLQKLSGQNFDLLFSKYNSLLPEKKENAILLDLACGTGEMSFRFAREGYDVIGADISPEMLSIAKNKIENNSNIQFICQDMINLDLFGTVDITVCTLDSLNHLESRVQFLEVVKKISMFTNKGGLFLFDINTEKKHRDILSDNIFTFKDKNIFAVWENSTTYNKEKDLCTDISITIFEKQKNSFYKKTEDFFKETAFPIKFIEEVLKSVGFKTLYDEKNEEKIIMLTIKE